jgi:hypothetical protein
LADSGKVFQKAFLRLTAAGTAPDFNGIPFSSLSVVTNKETKISGAKVV